MQELDVWLAEHAMEWKRWYIEPHPEFGCGIYPPECDFKSFTVPAPKGMPLNKHSPWGPIYRPFEPSTDPMASGRLLDKMTKLGWEWRVTGYSHGDVEAEFWKDQSTVYCGADKSKYLAIAIAARVALEKS